MVAQFRPGDRVQCVIEDVAFGGDGVARVSEMVLFIPFTVDGDEAEVEIIEVRKRYARGKIARIIKPSVHRIPPICPDYTRCGGCRMQHIAYGRQLELKRRQIEEIFRRIAAEPDPPVAAVIPSPLPFGWRGKAEFHLSGGRGEPRGIGLMAQASHDIIEVEHCDIVEESINRKYGEIRKALRLGEVRIEVERQIVWSDQPGEPPTGIFTGPGRAPDVERLVNGKRLTVAGRGFFQANMALVGELVSQVVGMCGLTGSETVIDAYGGAGLFSVFLAPKAGHLVGIEGDREAVRCAKKNLQRESRSNTEFLHGDVADILKDQFISRKRRADVALLDPPRDGCGDGVLDALAALHPERIVYVSCNPATQARDCRRLSEHGYTLRRLQPLDMFPQTAHIEDVALLTLGR